MKLKLLESNSVVQKLADALNISRASVYSRLKQAWTLEDFKTFYKNGEKVTKKASDFKIIAHILERQERLSMREFIAKFFQETEFNRREFARALEITLKQANEIIAFYAPNLYLEQEIKRSPKIWTELTKYKVTIKRGI